MARKILNRKELREEHDAAETSLEAGGEPAAAKAKDESAPGKTKGKPPAKRKSRAKAAKEVRLKAFWGVFNQTLRRVALFEYLPAGRGRQESRRSV